MFATLAEPHGTALGIHILGLVLNLFAMSSFSAETALM